MAGGDTVFALPLRDIVLFPGAAVPLFVGRPGAMRAAERAKDKDNHILVVTQKRADNEQPDTDGLYPFGTLASIRQTLPLPDGTVKVLIDTLKRMMLISFSSAKEAFEAQADVAVDQRDATIEHLRGLKEAFVDYTLLEAAHGDHGHAGLMRPSSAAASYLVDALEDHDIEMSTYKIAALVSLDVPRSAAFLAEPSAAARIAICKSWIFERANALHAAANHRR